MPVIQQVGTGSQHLNKYANYIQKNGGTVEWYGNKKTAHGYFR